MKSLRSALDGLYLAGAWVAGGLLVLLCGLVLFSVAARLFGFFAGGATDVAGYVMATATFLALAYTFRTEGHIRVALLIQGLHGPRRRAMELFCHALMAAVTLFLAFFMARLVWFSWEFGERSEGADAILMWIPQLPVAIGSALLALAVLHTLAEVIWDYDAVDPERAGRGEAPEV